MACDLRFVAAAQTLFSRGFQNRAISVWPWNENARTKQKQQTNGWRAIWLVYRTDTNARGLWLVKQNLGWKNFMPENFLKINRYFALTSYCNTIGQSRNAFSTLGFFFGWGGGWGKGTKRRCFDLFIHWLIKQITNTYETIFQGYTKIARMFTSDKSILPRRLALWLAIAHVREFRWQARLLVILGQRSHGTGRVFDRLNVRAFRCYVHTGSP